MRWISQGRQPDPVAITAPTILRLCIWEFGDGGNLSFFSGSWMVDYVVEQDVGDFSC
jgi:hypothetical protein